MKNTSTTTRPPVVAVMGHIDHGKSTLLDSIRKTSVVASEAGGITQHLSAYEIVIQYHDEMRAITFIDTPGHAAFTGMRERGARAADIAILVVSAEDGVKAQTIEALHTIKEAGIPFVVAINKIDRPSANIEKTKLSLAEKEVLVEGYGGTIPWVAISALSGAGISDLLETILLVSDVEGFSHDPEQKAVGVVIESRLDPKRGIAATIIIKNGTLHKGEFISAGQACTTTRIMENFLGKPIDAAPAGTAVQLIGFNTLPTVGSAIDVFTKKKDAEQACALHVENGARTHVIPEGAKVVPLIIKTDVFGTAEAIEQEIGKLHIENVYIKIVSKGNGAISEADIKHAQSDKGTIILGFNVGIDNGAREMGEKGNITIERFSVIYKLTEWLEAELEKRRPRTTERVVTGSAKVLKFFSKTKERQVVGCRIENGFLASGSHVTLMRRDFPLATGTVVEIQQAKQKVREAREGECGILIECKTDIAPGDVIEAAEFVER